MVWNAKKYYKDKYKNDPAYREKCIESAKKWQKNNPDKFKVIKKRYYDKHQTQILKKAEIWRNSEEGKIWLKNNYIKMDILQD